MRYLIYFVYQADGRVDDHVVFMLEALRPRFDIIHVIFNGTIRADQRDKLSFIERVQERGNDEFDVGAYKAALFSNTDEFYAQCTDLTFANFTCFAPIGSFDPLFRWADAMDADYWGISAHKAMTPNPFTKEGTLPYHIQSHWITVRNRMLKDPRFFAYWRDLPRIKSYDDSVIHHESQFTRHFEALGYKYRIYLDDTPYDSAYPAFNNVDQTLEAGLPLLKRRLFYQNPSYMDHYDVQARRALEYVQRNKLYPSNLIWDSVIGSTPPGLLYQNADLLYIGADARAADRPAAPRSGRALLLVTGVVGPAARAKILKSVGAAAHLHILIDESDDIEAWRQATGPAADQPIVHVQKYDELSDCFRQIQKLAAEFGGAEPVLFATVDGEDVRDFSYGIEHLMLDTCVVACVMRTFADNERLGVLIPAIKTYGPNAETDHLIDSVKTETASDLMRFGVKLPRDQHVLFSRSGVAWYRSDLLAAVAGHVAEVCDACADHAPADGGSDIDYEAMGRAGIEIDAGDIDTFLDFGVPYWAAERGYLTAVFSNTSALARNFVKLEARYRKLSETLELKTAFNVEERSRYLAQFVSQEDREDVWREISTSAFEEGWKKASAAVWARAFEEGRKSVLSKGAAASALAAATSTSSSAANTNRAFAALTKSAHGVGKWAIKTLNPMAHARKKRK